jgi:hypothetical protein
MGNICEGYAKDVDNQCVDQDGDIPCTKDACQSAGGVSCCPASAAPSDLCECECSGDPSDCPGYDPGPGDPWWTWWLDLLLDPGVVKFLCIVAALAACCVVKCFVDDRRHNQRMKRMQQGHGSLLGRQQPQFEHAQGHAAYGTMAGEEALVVPACPVGMPSTTQFPA